MLNGIIELILVLATIVYVYPFMKTIAVSLVGKKHAEEAVYEVLKFNDGTFVFDPQEVSVKKPEITASITSLLMEGCRILDEASLDDPRLDDVINP